MNFQKRKVINSEPFNKKYLNMSKRRRLNEEYNDDDDGNKDNIKKCIFYMCDYFFIALIGYLAFKTFFEGIKYSINN